MTESAHHGIAVTYLLFALTGVGLVLPGTLLPLLTARCGLDDGQSGLLFFLFFVGTSLGAFAARGTLGPMLGLATLTMSLPLAIVARLHGAAVVFAFLACGFGLGLAMTAVSLLQSRRYPGAKLPELTRLNLVWAVGACAGPFLLLRASTALGIGFALRGYAATVLVVGACVTAYVWYEPVPPGGVWHAWRDIRQLPLFFAVCLPLATGVEGAAGGWVTSYVARESWKVGTIITASTSLWAGLLVSRLLFSGRGASLVLRRKASSSLAFLSAFGLVLLLSGTHPALAVAGGFCIGFGVGPLYPYLLSSLMERSEAGNAGFLAAGVGSALLPLLTGCLSKETHSLRAGLLVPLISALVLAMIFSSGANDAGRSDT